MSERPSLASMGDAAGDILIVDDFPDTLVLYEAILTDDGHRVRTAQSGIEALRQVDQREPELVLLDVSMPGLDGVEVLRRLRARRGGGPSVIMLTAARREPHAIEAGLKEGADAYLTKPIDSRELMARVRAALETFRLKRMLEAQRRDHIAMLVHDLRHPLSSLGLIAEVLESEDMTPTERHAAVTQIRGMCTEMARLVDGVLVASRLEAGVFTVERRLIKVGAVIEPMLGVFTPVATRRRIALVFEGSLDLEVRADPQKLRQALDNLVANALKFTPRGGRVVVRVAREAGHIVLEISDTGPGIPAGERESIFDRYKQGSRGRAAGGAGLGLAIARGIAEAHQGTVSVAGGASAGAAFRIVLPA
jgi:two-component system, sensor histidine kinase and response regulator